MALNQSSRDGKELTGYQLLALGYVATNFESGIVPKAGQEFLVTYSGLNFNIGTGVLIDSGLIVHNDAQITDIPLSTGGINGTKYLVIENNRNSGISTVKFVSSVINTNLVQNPQGTSHFLLATVQHSSSGITGVKEAKKKIGNQKTILFEGGTWSIGTNKDLGITKEEMAEYSNIICKSDRANVDMRGSDVLATGNVRMLGGYESGTNGHAYMQATIGHISGTVWTLMSCSVTYSYNNNAGITGNLTYLVAYR